MYSQFAQNPINGRVPLPHEDQAHFYPGGLPDLDSIGMPSAPSEGLPPGERGYFCGFDTLATAGHAPSVSAETVFLVGYEGGLRLYKVSRKEVFIIGTIEGLKGGVYGAKILPWTCRSDPGSHGRPYIALVVHGPISADDDSGSSGASDTPDSDEQDASSLPRTQRNATGFAMQDLLKQYQTTVEIYSLSTRKHVCTVFRSRPVDVEFSRLAEYVIPPPIGDLKLDAKGKFLVVASGASGEIFVYSPFTRDPDIHGLESMRCIGKLWTTIRHREIKSSASAPGGDVPPYPDETEVMVNIPLFSLSHRWIATVPPPADSLFSANSTVLVSNDARPPGGNMHISPPRPPTNCDVDTPETDGLLDRVSRHVTQGVLKGAQWVSEQGMQVLNSYLNRGPPGGLPNNQHPHVAEIPPAFPPTHGHSSAPASSPTQVAIFDLQRLLDAEETKIKNALQPLATFEPPSGCSFISFAPSGLNLLTVSKSGDQQIVWSLMRMQHPRSGTTLGHYPSPYVRQMIRFTRMTVASVVDVVWAAPAGDFFALITEKGTIHVHVIPSSAFLWPPLRRSRRQKDMQRLEKEHVDSSKTTMGTALDAVNGTGAWIRSLSTRSQSLGSSAAFPNLMMAPASTANVGIKAVRAGITKGVKVAANSAQTIYHASENKLQMGNLMNGVSPGLMHWMTGRDRGHLAIVVTGTLSIYPVKQVSTPQKGRPPVIRARISKRPFEERLHKIPDDQFPPAFRARIEHRFHQPGGGATKPLPGSGGSWNLRAPHGGGGDDAGAARRQPENWHALVEAETNPPYQPFHTDRRVTLMAFAEPEPGPFGVMPSMIPAEHGAGGEHEDTDAEDRADEDAGGYYDEYADEEHPIDDAPSWERAVLAPWLRGAHHAGLPSGGAEPEHAPWIFGRDIPAARAFASAGGGAAVDASDDDRDGDAVENRIRVVEGAEGEQVIVTTMRRKGREEEFFEDGCEVVDFADDRV
jgi:hypothetical protein